MIRFEELLVGLMELIPLSVGDGTTEVSVTELQINTPIETRVMSDGSLRGTLPRGRMATGFDAPHSRLYARFATRSG